MGEGALFLIEYTAADAVFEAAVGWFEAMMVLIKGTYAAFSKACHTLNARCGAKQNIALLIYILKHPEILATKVQATFVRHGRPRDSSQNT